MCVFQLGKTFSPIPEEHMNEAEVLMFLDDVKLVFRLLSGVKHQVAFDVDPFIKPSLRSSLLGDTLCADSGRASW